MNQIHLIIPFSRPENVEKLVNGYRPMNIILHPITFQDEDIQFNESDNQWILPLVIPMDHKDCKAHMPGCYKRNWFIENEEIIDNDYYVTADDDDFYEDGVFDAIKQMDDDIIIISLKRGNHTPEGLPVQRRYPTFTLTAYPYNVKCGCISAQQSFVKGRLFKAHKHNEELHWWDGQIAMYYKNTGEQIRYEPDLFGLFNYFEPGRWA